jgi:hypothetical protein
VVRSSSFSSVIRFPSFTVNTAEYQSRILGDEPAPKQQISLGQVGQCWKMRPHSSSQIRAPTAVTSGLSKIYAFFLRARKYYKTLKVSLQSCGNYQICDSRDELGRRFCASSLGRYTNNVRIEIRCPLLRKFRNKSLYYRSRTIIIIENFAHRMTF